MKFSVCLEFFYKDLPIEERIPKVRELGFDGGELWFWRDRDLEKIRREADRCGFTITSLCAHGPIPGFNDRSAHGELEKDWRGAMDAAEVLGCRRLLVLGGTTLDGVSHAEQLAAIVDGLRRAAAEAEGRNQVLTLEVLNSKQDFPGYFLDNTEDLFGIVRAVDRPGLRAVYDLYHIGMMEGDLIGNVRRNLELIESFQIAAVPGRHEPEFGSLNAPALCRVLDEEGFDGYLCFEYAPSLDSTESLTRTLAWLQSEGD